MASSSSSNLWLDAVRVLSREGTHLVNFDQPDKRLVLEDILALVQAKREQCIQGCWKYTRRNGKVVVLRDVCDRVFNVVSKFMEFGPVIAQIDPIHVGLPWAALYSLLKVSKRPSH